MPSNLQLLQHSGTEGVVRGSQHNVCISGTVVGVAELDGLQLLPVGSGKQPVVQLGVLLLSIQLGTAVATGSDTSVELISQS